MFSNKKRLLEKRVAKINKKCGIPVFIGEFSNPSGKMEGPFAGRNKKVREYNKDQHGQADIYADVVVGGATAWQHLLPGFRLRGLVYDVHVRICQ